MADRGTWIAVAGRRLYRWRELLGVLGYLVALALSDFSFVALLFGLPLIALGLGLRFWAAGYIGQHGRGREIELVELVQTGPYRWTAHPLYLGNGLLVAGVLVALAPPWWLRLLIGVLFVVEYWLIAQAESQELATVGSGQQGKEWQLRRALGEWQTVATVVVAIFLAALVARF
ncbi:hypothetical protein FJY69_04110 [candidate division WOR-3 bacterium]|nr:hypothetical protein [candidate division WOR-3 bacterium]